MNPNYYIHTGDVLETLQTFPDNYFDGVLTDPPYEIGFMNKKWDNSGISYQTELWKQINRVLCPGGHVLAFGAPRTHHRLMVAMEDGELEIHDCLMWLYSSGFPKGPSCLKPAWEPIVLARKYAPTRLPLNIANCRVGSEHRINPPAHNRQGSGWGMRDNQQSKEVVGRWPSNLLLEEELEPGLERYFYCPKASKRERELGGPNQHPTVKPLGLTEWLARLILPSTEKSRILVPFSGSGSEMIGCLKAGWSEVVGIEKEWEYVEVSHSRIAQGYSSSGLSKRG